MARIPEAELERLKREVSLVRLIQSQGHELKKRGKDWVMHCVFHDESTPRQFGKFEVRKPLFMRLSGKVAHFQSTF